MYFASDWRRWHSRISAAARFSTDLEEWTASVPPEPTQTMAFNHWKAGRTLEFCLTGPLIFAVSHNFDTAFMTVLETTGLCWICKQDETCLGGATLFQIAMLSGPKIKWSFLVILLTHHPRIFCTLYFCRSESVPGVLVGDVFLLTDVFRCHVSCIQQNWMAKDQSICGLPGYFDFADVTSSS